MRHDIYVFLHIAKRATQHQTHLRPDSSLLQYSLCMRSAGQQPAVMSLVFTVLPQVVTSITGVRHADIVISGGLSAVGESIVVAANLLNK